MSDTDLIRYLHGELDAAEHAHVVARIAASAEAAERMRVLQQREARLTSLLHAVDPHADEIDASARRIREAIAAPGVHAGSIDAQAGDSIDARAGDAIHVRAGDSIHARAGDAIDVRQSSGQASVGERVLTHEHWWRRVPPAFRAAAAAAAMIGVLMLVEPARAWVITNVRAVAAAIGLIDEPDADSRAPDADVPDPAAQAAEANARLAFPWAASEIVIDAGDLRGTITVRRGTTDRVMVEVAVPGDAEDANTLVTPEGLRFEGGSAVQVDAVITVPPSLRSLRVDSRGTRRTYAAPAEGTEVRIGL